MNDAGQFYTNRVLKDSKDSRASKDWKATAQSHVDWTKSWVSALTNLHAMVKQYHTTGLVWNPKGGDAKAVKGKIIVPSNIFIFLYKKYGESHGNNKYTFKHMY